MKRLVIRLLAFLAPLIALHAEWQPANGPYGGFITNVFYSSAGYLFCADNDGNIFKRKPDSDKWQEAGKFSQREEFTSFFTSNREGLIYASNDFQLLMTKDTGSTWQERQLPQDGLQITSILAVGSRILLSTFTNGSFISNDSGATWSMLSDPLIDSVVIKHFAFTSRNIVIASTNKGLITSPDTCKTWVAVDNLPKNTQFNQVAEDENGTLYAAELNKGLFKSLDDGKSWINIFNEPKDSIGFIRLVIGKGGVMYSLCEKLFDDCQEFKMLKSSDNGLSWYEDELGRALSYYYYHIRFSRDNVGNLYIATYDQGILRSVDNGASWHQFNEGSIKYEVNFTAETSNSHIVAGTDLNGIYISADSGTSWNEINDTIYNTSVKKIFCDRNNNIYAWISFANRNNFTVGIYQYDLENEKWELIKYDDNLNNFYVSPRGSLWIIRSEGIFLSNDKGSTWTEILDNGKRLRYSSLTGGSDSSIFIYSGGNIYNIDPDGNIINKISQEGKPFYSSNDIKIKYYDPDLFLISGYFIYKSSDRGLTWDTILDDSFDTFSGFTGIIDNLFLKDKSGNLIVGSITGKLVFSADEGRHYQEFTNSPPESIFNSIQELNNSKLLLSTHNGMFFSDGVDSFKPWLIQVDSVVRKSLEYDAEVNFRVLLKDYSGNPVKNWKITVTDSLAERITDITTNDSGIVNYSTKVPHFKPKGRYSIKFAALRTSDNKQFSAYQYLSVFHRDTLSISLNISDTLDVDLNYFTYQEIETKVTDESGKFINGAKVKMYESIQDSWEECSTTADGSCKFNLIVPESTADGIYPLLFIASSMFNVPSDSIHKFVKVFRSTGVDGDAEKAKVTLKMKISPNPALEYCEIIINCFNPGLSRFVISDLLGNEIFSDAVGADYLVGKRIDTVQFSSGIYSASLVTGCDVLTMPLVIIK